MKPKRGTISLGRPATAAVVVYLMVASVVTGALAPVAAATPSTYAPIKWLLIQDGSVGDYGDRAGYHQFWLNFMRDLGTPFDVVTDSAVTSATFWSGSGEPKYQAFIDAGADCTSMALSRPDCPGLHRQAPSAALGAMKSAVHGGIDGVFVASAIQGLQHLWGISSVGEMGTDQKVTWKVVSSFTGINGTAFSAGFNTTSVDPVRQIVTTGWSGNGSMLIQASWPGGSAVASASVPYGTGTAYFWSGTEGRRSSYREGYQSVFSMATGDMSSGSNTNYNVAQQLRGSLFRYVYDAWKYKVQILPWQTGGSAVIFRMDDGYIGQIYNATYPWDSGWNLNELASAGLSADLTVPVQGGYVTAVENCPLSGRDVGSAFPPYTSSGYRFFCSWNEGGFTNHAMVFSRLDNITQSVDDGSVKVLGDASQTFAMSDGNSTLIRQLKVKISAVPGSVYRVRILNPSGTVAWSSSPLNEAFSSPTWVTFRPNATFVQGTGLSVEISVTSGSVTWETASPGTYPGGSLASDPSSDADFVVVGGTPWDIVSLDLNHNLSWADDPETTQAGLAMAGGARYPSENTTFQFRGFPPQDSFKRFTAEWVSGRTNSNGPPTRLTLVWYSTEGDWTNTVAGQATRSFYLNYTKNFGFGMVFDGRFHHPYQGSSYRASDYSWDANSSYYSYGSILAEQASLVHEAKAIFGQSFDTLVLTAPFSGDSYPPGAIYDPAHGEGAFWKSGQRIAWMGNDQLAPSGLWRNVVVGGFRQYEPKSTFDGVSQLSWGNGYTFEGANYQDMQLLRADFAGAQVKSGLTASELLAYYDLYPPRYKQPFDLNSTVFMGTTQNLFSFWNSTMSMLEGMPAAYYQGGNLTLEFNARNDVPGPVDDLVWRFPGQSPFGDGLTLRSVVSNVTGWSVANQTSEYVHLEAPLATGKTRIVASYGTGPVEVRIGTAPNGLSAAFYVDGTVCQLAPCTYHWATGSAHNVTAATVTPSGAGTRYAWLSWPSAGSREFVATAHFLPEDITAQFGAQHLLTVAGPCPTYGGGWFDSGAVAVASATGVCLRMGGEGVRISSILLDGGRNSSVATRGNATINVTMKAAHTVTFTSVTQFSLGLDPAATLGLVSITPPTLAGDRSWYDNGTAVTLVIRGIYARDSGEGVRLGGFILNGWNATAVREDSNVTVLKKYPLRSPLSVAATLVNDYKVTVNASPPGYGAIVSLTPPSIPGDAGWFDAGTTVALKASPNAGYEFSEWAGNILLTSGQQNPILSIALSQPVKETAVFGALQAVQTTTTSRQQGQPPLGPELLPILAAGILVALSAYAAYSYRKKEVSEGVEAGAPLALRRESGLG
ncbi:MAG TPA: hypothetical protein VKF15_02075 [Nitrososphaerales archaeon]|nr:hypothetical protein [Nitrososphaerales archaeon]